MRKKIVTLEGKFPWQIALDLVNADKERKAQEEQARKDREALERQATADRQALERQAEADRQTAIRQAEAERQSAERVAVAQAQAEKAKAEARIKKSEEEKIRFEKETILRSQAQSIIEQKRQEQSLRELLAEKERLLAKEQKIIEAKKILNQPISEEEEETLEGIKMKIKSIKRTLPRPSLPKASPLKSMKLTPFGVLPKSTFAKAHQPKTKKGKKQKRAQETGVAKGVGVVGLGVGAVFGAPLLASGIASLGSSFLSSSGGILSALKGSSAISSVLGQSNPMSAGNIESGSDWGGQSMLETFANPSIQPVREEEVTDQDFIESYEESNLLGQSSQTKKAPKKKVIIKKKDKKTGQVAQRKTVSKPISTKKPVQKPIGKKVLNQSFQPYAKPSQTRNYPVQSVSYYEPPEIEFDQSEIMEQEYRDTSQEVPFVSDYDYSPFENEMEDDAENYTGLEE